MVGPSRRLNGMENYIVRIYRHEKNKPHKLMGIVEKVGEEGKKAFTHVDELWEILNAPRRLSKQQRKQGENKGKKEKM
jgi:hypothetical protein